MTNEVKIKLSGGLFALAGLHLFGLMVVMYLFHPWALHKNPQPSGWHPPRAVPVSGAHCPPGCDCSSPDCPPDCDCTPVGNMVIKGRELIDVPETNLAAQGEMKQQCFPCVNRRTTTRTITRPTTTVYQSSPVIYPTVTRISYPSAPVAQLAPKPAPAPVAQPVADPLSQPTGNITIPQSPPPTEAAKPMQQQKDYQVALFVDSPNHPLVAWFNQHPKLTQLRAASDFQVYTPTNTLYRTRYANDIPVSQFPVMLLQDQRGGHIHAAGGPMLPESAETLWNDICDAKLLYDQAMQAPIESNFNGAYRTAGYKFDEDILPTLRLDSALMQAADCPDGYCEPEANGRNRMFPNLFDRAEKKAEAIFWGGTTDMIAIFLMFVVCILGVLVAVKHLTPRD